MVWCCLTEPGQGQKGELVQVRAKGGGEWVLGLQPGGNPASCALSLRFLVSETEQYQPEKLK